MSHMSVYQVERQDFFNMSKEYQDLVIHLLKTHAEGELTGSDVYTQSLFPIAPNAYERYICCLRAAEEVDHYIKTAELLDELGLDTSYMTSQKVMERDLYPLEAVRYDFRKWEDRATFSALGEYAAHFNIENMADSSYRPLARICPKILKEETGHVAHGWRILQELCQTEEGHCRAQEAVNRWFPIALDCFGKSNSVRSALYIKWGIKKNSNEELRREYLTALVPRLESLGLSAPDPRVNRKFA